MNRHLSSSDICQGSSSVLQPCEFRVYKRWKEEQMQQAMQDVINGTRTAHEASRLFKIPRSSLRDRIKAKKKQLHMSMETYTS